MMNNTTKQCIIHYDSINTKEPLRGLTDVTLKSLKENKEIRQKLGGENYHYQQCAGIPDTLNSNYYLHPECFKKFIYAKTLEKRKYQSNGDAINISKMQRTTRSSQSIDAVEKGGLFPDMCMICEKKKIKVRGKDYYTTRISTRDAEETLKKAALLKKDEEMLLEIQDLDLIAKEFKKHDKCYRDYTRLIYDSLEEEKNPIYCSGDYEAVVKIIEEQVISQFKCVSMTVLMAVYGIGDNHLQYRYKLKNRLQNTFGNAITFLSPDYHSIQIVISTKCFHEQNLSSFVSDLEPEIILKNAANYLRISVRNSYKEVEKLSWPPTVEELKEENRKPPMVLLKFLCDLIFGERSRCEVSEKKMRIARSIADDLVYNITNRSIVTLKHCSVALGLHAMTGQKQIIVLLSQLGHCISYDAVREI